MMNWRRKKRYRDYDINPDEVFIDTMNVSGLDQQQFEGVIEQRISSRSLSLFTAVVIGIAVIFSLQLFRLQVLKGEAFAEQAENNRLNRIPIFAERGIIYDKNRVELAWNVQHPEQPFLSRAYIAQEGFGHILGYVNYPQKDSNGYYWRRSVTGQDGLEKKYDELLSGENGARLYEVDALGTVLSEQYLNEAEAGTNLITTVDARLQGALFDAIKKQALEADFTGGAGVIMDVRSGSLAVLTSYPEYDPYTLAEGVDAETISGFFNDPGKPFLNRALSGLYSPGSTVKPFLALAALNEGLVTDKTIVYSYGRIQVPNPYNPQNTSIFRDWRPEGHGPTDIYHAIADSVNTYFYAIGGGYQNQSGLGISRIEKYVNDFGIASPTGIDFGTEVSGTIPTPEWKGRLFADGTWRLGDTYNTSIGQFGFQVGVLQMARSIGAIANSGTLHTPYIVGAFRGQSVEIDNEISEEHYAIVREAMRQTVTEGTAALLNNPHISVAAKTGTAQVGVNNEFKNSWAVGYFPAENPVYSFAVVMERAPNTEANQGSAGRAFRDFLATVTEKNPEVWEELNAQE